MSVTSGGFFKTCPPFCIHWQALQPDEKPCTSNKDSRNNCLCSVKPIASSILCLHKTLCFGLRFSFFTTACRPFLLVTSLDKFASMELEHLHVEFVGHICNCKAQAKYFIKQLLQQQNHQDYKDVQALHTSRRE